MYFHRLCTDIQTHKGQTVIFIYGIVSKLVSYIREYIKLKKRLAIRIKAFYKLVFVTNLLLTEIQVNFDS